MTTIAIQQVKFDVGGTKYKVARSLIEAYPGTMLASLVSDRWEQDLNSEFFIDRDGERFRYVLDYMRDQKVSLPMKLARASIQTELEYFGFKNVEAGAIQSSCSKVEITKLLSLCWKKHEAEIESIDARVAQLDIERENFMKDNKAKREGLYAKKNFTKIAFACARRLGKCGDMSQVLFSKMDDRAMCVLFETQMPVWGNQEYYDIQVECFNVYLTVYNLCYVKHLFSADGVLISLRELDSTGPAASSGTV